MIRSAIIFIGGGIGSVLRYFVSAWIYGILGTNFPYGTLVVNVVGSFVIGFFLTLAGDRFLVSPDLRAFIAIGIIGGFTTFSTFTFETLELIKEGSYIVGGTNIVLSILCALLAAWAGNAVGKLV